MLDVPMKSASTLGYFGDEPLSRGGVAPGARALEATLPLPAADEVKYSTCYMCACRCGIKVHLKSGRIRYIEGNRQHPVNRGVLCAKGSAGIMQQYSPAKLTKPLLRVGERGNAEFREIEWAEAIGLAAERLARIRATDPKKLAFFTGRDQSQSLTGWWAKQFGTPNFAAHGGFCSVNMAAAGFYTIGGSFWEFGEPDWELTKYFMLFGVAEDHDSNPIKIGLSKLKARGVKTISVNPVRTGYSAVADEWIGIRPGTDGLFAFALIHELLHADRIDLDYLVRYTNAPWLVVQNPGGSDDGLFARDHASGKPLAWDRRASRSRRLVGGDRAGRVRPIHFARRAARRSRVPAHRRALHGCTVLAGGHSFALRHPGRNDPAHCGRACPRGVRPGDRASATLDRLGRAPSRRDGWQAGRHACHAGDLGAFQRLSQLSRAARPADAVGSRRFARLIPLPGAVSAPHSRCTKPGWKERRRQYAARRHAARQPDQSRGPARGSRWNADAHRQGVFVGGTDRCAWPDAHGDSQCLGRRSVQDRHAVHVHVQHGLELGHEHRPDDRHADREGGKWRIQDSAHHLFRRIFLRDGRLRRPGIARYDLSRALGLYFAARSADQQCGRSGRCHSPA